MYPYWDIVSVKTKNFISSKPCFQLDICFQLPEKTSRKNIMWCNVTCYPAWILKFQWQKLIMINHNHYSNYDYATWNLLELNQSWVFWKFLVYSATRIRGIIIFHLFIFLFVTYILNYFGTVVSLKVGKVGEWIQRMGKYPLTYPSVRESILTLIGKSWKTHPIFFRNFDFRTMSWKIHPSIFCEFLFSFC